MVLENEHHLLSALLSFKIVVFDIIMPHLDDKIKVQYVTSFCVWKSFQNAHIRMYVLSVSAAAAVLFFLGLREGSLSLSLFPFFVFLSVCLSVCKYQEGQKKQGYISPLRLSLHFLSGQAIDGFWASRQRSVSRGTEEVR